MAPTLQPMSPPAAIPAAPRQLHLALIDDDAEFRGAIVSSLRCSTDIHLAAVAANPADGLLLLAQAPADVLVVASWLQEGDGLDIIRHAARAWPGCGILVSTALGDRADLIECIEAGAAGFLAKDSTPDQMLDEIRGAGGGGGTINPLLAHRILTRVRHEGPPLSSYEAHALELVARGFTLDEVARRMHVSRQTVQGFVRHIYGRLEALARQASA